MHADCTTPHTLYDLARALRDELLTRRDLAADFEGAGAGALCFLITAAAAYKVGQARRKAAARRDPRTPRMRAADKARALRAAGALVIFDGPAALVQSTSRAGVVHRVEAGRCTCEAGQVGRPCWHVAAARQERKARAERRAARVAATLATLRARTAA